MVGTVSALHIILSPLASYFSMLWTISNIQCLYLHALRLPLELQKAVLLMAVQKSQGINTLISPLKPWEFCKYPSFLSLELNYTVFFTVILSFSVVLTPAVHCE